MKKISIKTSVIVYLLTSVLITSAILGSLAVSNLKKSTKQASEKYNTAMNDGYKTEIKSEVETAITVMQSAYDRYKSGTITEAAAKNMAKETIRNMRYREDGSGYFWIDDTNYTLIMHPILTEQEGDNRKNETDKNGVKIIQKILDSVTTNKNADGFNEFYYTKSDGKTVAPKLAYSELFEPWGWIVSTGNYVDDMQKEMRSTKSQLNSYSAKLQRSIFIIFFIIIIAIIISGNIFSTYLCNPIRKLADIGKDISHGKISDEIQQNSRHREINALQNSFRELLETFRGQADSIQKLSNGDFSITVTPKSDDDVVGNALNSMPAKLKKHPYIEELKAVHKKLKDQYTRSRVMLEQAMEDCTRFEESELRKLMQNPVIWPLLRHLVFICNGQTGFYTDGLLVTVNAVCLPLKPKDELRIAHPTDLYASGDVVPSNVTVAVFPSSVFVPLIGVVSYPS